MHHRRVNAGFFQTLGSPGGAATVGMTANDPPLVNGLPSMRSRITSQPQAKLTEIHRGTSRFQPALLPMSTVQRDQTEKANIMSSQPQPAHHDLADNQRVPRTPAVLVFDVNETLLDFESMTPLFEQIFGDRRILRDWMGHLFMYSMTLTLSGLYVDFFTLGQGLLSMLADTHGVDATHEDIRRIKDSMLTMPAHPDVEPGLTLLRDNGSGW